MSRLTLKEFRKLPKDEKAERFKELSDHDRFLWRISEPVFGEVVAERPLTGEEVKREEAFLDDLEELLEKKNWDRSMADELRENLRKRPVAGTLEEAERNWKRK